mgnify:CR=1 FL=1
MPQGVASVAGPMGYTGDCRKDVLVECEAEASVVLNYAPPERKRVHKPWNECGIVESSIQGFGPRHRAQPELPGCHFVNWWPVPIRAMLEALA